MVQNLQKDTSAVVFLQAFNFIKKDSGTGVFLQIFFEIIKGNFFIKHLGAIASECWQLEKYSWLLVEDIIFHPIQIAPYRDHHVWCTKRHRDPKSYSELSAQH